MFKRLFSKRERQLRDQRIQELEKSAREEILAEQIRQEEYIRSISSHNMGLFMPACSGTIDMNAVFNYTDPCGDIPAPFSTGVVDQAEHLREKRRRRNADHISCPGGLSG